MTKIIWIVLGILLVADCAVFGYFFSQTYSEYENFRNREQAQTAELEQSKQELTGKQVYHRRLYNDPEFLERVVRERLNYSRANERVFIFPEPTAAP
jgi:cell division protein FtsB